MSPGSPKPTFYVAPRRRRRADGPGRSPANFTRTKTTCVKARRGGAPPTSGEQVEGRRREVRGTCGGEAPPARPRSGSEWPGRSTRGGVPSARRRAGAQPRQLHENKNHMRENAPGRSPANFRRTSRGTPARSSRNLRGRSPARAPPLRERVGATPQRGSEKKPRGGGSEKYTRTCWTGRPHIRLTSIFVREVGRGVAPPRL